MRKVVDITDKLSFEETAGIKAGEETYKVKTNAATILQLMSLMKNGGDPLEMYDLLFTEEAKKKISTSKLSFNDLLKVIETGVDIATGEDSQEKTPGEQ